MRDHLMRHLRLAILPGKPAFPCAYNELYDQAYRFWVEYWESTRREVGLAATSLHSDDFLRNDLVNILLYKDDVIGMINCTLLDFSHAAARSHSYVQTYFNEMFLATLSSLRLRRMATLENIFLNPAWRSARVGFSLGAVLMAIALRKAGEAGCEGVFGAPRKDAPTSRICYDLGARPVVTGLTFHGKPTDLCIWNIADVRPHPVPEVNALTAHLWSARLDMTEWAANQQPTKDVA